MKLRTACFYENTICISENNSGSSRGTTNLLILFFWLDETRTSVTSVTLDPIRGMSGHKKKRFDLV